MIYHSNFIFGAPLSKARQEEFRSAVLARFDGDMTKAQSYIEKEADRQIGKGSGLLSCAALLSGMSYFTHAKAPLFFTLIALLLVLASFYSKWPIESSVVSDPSKEFDRTFHLCINRCICNAVSTFLILIAVVILFVNLLAA